MAGKASLIFTVTGVVASLTLAACKPKQAADPRTADRQVQTALVEPAAGTARSYTGVVTARVVSDISFRIPGKIVERLVDTGQTVRQGQVLMRLDPTDYTHAVTSQVGSVASIRAHWQQAAADEQRYRGLVATGAVSASSYDQVKAAADSARAQLDAAQAQEKVARNQDDYALLRADADGVIVQTLAEPGHVIVAGQPVIRLAHAGPREAAVNLPETIRPLLHSEVDAYLYGVEQKITATLRQLSDAADPATRTFEARYVMQGVGADAPLGATVNVILPRNPLSSDAMAVPLGAIDDEGQGPGVWTVDIKTQRVSFHHVTLLAVAEESATLCGNAPDGPHAGDLVVATGGHYLHAGEHVVLASSRVLMQ